VTTLITRKLQYDNRVALQQADQAIRKDVVRALVELVTNCNDSYRRLEDEGVPTSGLIIIERQGRQINSVIRVRDYAEGMNGEQMDQKVGVYGAATSGFNEGQSVRGLWGRGIKDAFYGLGHGQVQSFRDGLFHRCSLSIVTTTPTFNLEKPLRATRVLRKQFEVLTGNGTISEIIVSRPDVRIPQFDTLRRMLERHFELRAIMSSSKRRIVLRDLDGRGKIKQEVSLGYKSPIGPQILDESFDVTGFPAKVRLEVFRSNEQLSTPAEEGDYADGGFLVISNSI
jgi:hypothetical protein